MTPIEYIGPAPRKKKRQPLLGGWVIFLLSGIFVFYFAWPSFADFIKEQEDGASPNNVTKAIARLRQSPNFGNTLAAEALIRTKAPVQFDASYYPIEFPMGDIPQDKGAKADVIIRSYRGAGIDLQAHVHSDMKQHFRIYPQLWGMRAPDTNIDHRRIPNLQRFLMRKGETMRASRTPKSYHFGDIVIWRLPDGQPHIGILVPGPGTRHEERWVVHNIGEGTVWEDALLDYEIIGHYRYQN